MNKRRLQSLINWAAAANGHAFRANKALAEECHRLYGAEPGDVDADEIIDAVLGGCGDSSAGMTAERFDESHEKAD